MLIAMAITAVRMRKNRILTTQVHIKTYRSRTATTNPAAMRAAILYPGAIVSTMWL